MYQINKALSDYMESKGLKQSFVAQRAGVPVDTLSRICTSKRRILADEFILICRALDIDPRSIWTPQTNEGG